MDEPNQTKKMHIQVATNNFHNVLNKGNNKRMDVCCYKYHKKVGIENESGGYCITFNKTKAC